MYSPKKPRLLKKVYLVRLLNHLFLSYLPLSLEMT